MNDMVKPNRSEFLGGSDIPAVMGLSPYKTPVQLFLQKTGQSEPEKPNKMRQRALERGKKLEPYVLDMVIDKLREQGHEVELIATNKRYTHGYYPFLSCEIDFELVVDGEHINGDCKTATGFARKEWGEEQTDEVPIHYAAQFMHGLGITGRKRCVVAALIGLDDVAIYWVERDEETIMGMQKKAIEFWNNHVMTGIAPDPIKFEDVGILYPGDNGKAIEASNDIALKVSELDGIKGQLKVLVERADELKYQIAEYISPNAILMFAGKQIATWKAQNQSILDQKRFKEEHKDLHAQYVNHKRIRVLRTKG
ncbi:MAG: YqaJ viral recombinase family protein [Betaproteobacteria bacterium]